MIVFLKVSHRNGLVGCTDQPVGSRRCKNIKVKSAYENRMRSFKLFQALAILLLASRFGLLATLDAGAFIMLSLTEFGKHAGLRTSSLKSAKRAV